MKGVLLMVAVLLSGCYGLPTEPRPPKDTMCPFPPGTHFAFIGDGSGVSLGIPGGDIKTGHWWVSSERISQTWRPIPSTARDLVGVLPPMRVACGIFDDGSGEVGTVPDNWHPPFDASSS